MDACTTTILDRSVAGLARNLIRCIISPNQDDLSYSSKISFSGQQKMVKLPNTLWLAEQRRPVQTAHWPFFNSSSSSMDTWGNLSNLWIPCVYHIDQGIPVEYELDTFNTPPQEQLYVTPKIGYVDAMPLFRSRHLALISPLGHFNGDNARLSPNHQTHKTQGDSKVYFLQRQTRLSLNYNEHNPSHVRR